MKNIVVHIYRLSKILLKDTDTAIGPIGNATGGVAAGIFGNFEDKPRTGIAGGGPSGNRTSVYSTELHKAYKNGLIDKQTTRILRAGGRKVAKVIPYVGSAITLYQVYDAGNCDDSNTNVLYPSSNQLGPVIITCLRKARFAEKEIIRNRSAWIKKLCAANK